MTGLSLRQTSTVPTFANHPIYRKPKGSLPDKVISLYPHRNEFDSAIVFTRRLVDALHPMGIETVDRQPLQGTTERGHQLRRYIANSNFNGNVDEAAGAVLTLEDTICQAREIKRELKGRDRPTFILQVHGMDKVSEDTPFVETTVKRIAGTIFTFGTFDDVIQNCLGRFEEITDAMQGIAKLLSINLDSALKELQSLRKELRPSRGIVKFLEVPSERVCLPASHEMYGHYFEKDGTQKAVSDYEEKYCMHWKQIADFTQKDVEKVARLLVIPKR